MRELTQGLNQVAHARTTARLLPSNTYGHHRRHAPDDEALDGLVLGDGLASRGAAEAPANPTHGPSNIHEQQQVLTDRQLRFIAAWALLCTANPRCIRQPLSRQPPAPRDRLLRTGLTCSIWTVHAVYVVCSMKGLQSDHIWGQTGCCTHRTRFTWPRPFLDLPWFLRLTVMFPTCTKMHKHSKS